MATCARWCVATASATLGNAGVAIRRIDISNVLQRIGIAYENVSSGVLKDVLFPVANLDAEFKQNLEAVAQSSADVYIRRLLESRTVEENAVAELREGGLLIGETALARGLVDENGGFLTAIAAVARLIDTPQVELVELTPRKTSQAGVAAQVMKFLGDLV